MATEKKDAAASGHRIIFRGEFLSKALMGGDQECYFEFAVTGVDTPEASIRIKNQFGASTVVISGTRDLNRLAEWLAESSWEISKRIESTNELEARLNKEDVDGKA